MLSAENHQWFNKQSKQEQARMNEAFQEYKRKLDYRISVAEITTEGIKQSQVIEFEISEEVLEIPVYETTPEEQVKDEEYKRRRNERVFSKFKGEER